MIKPLIFIHNYDILRLNFMRFQKGVIDEKTYRLLFARVEKSTGKKTIAASWSTPSW